jgi:1-acyl-sn-glycerol-3-phosphate acyltransferase
VKKINKDNIIFIGTTYPIGVILGIMFNLLRLLRRIKVHHPERFPHGRGNVVLVSNHPSLLEPFLLITLFFRDYLFHPFKYGPWSTPDIKNFYNRWFFFWLRPRAIPIPRESEGGKKDSFNQMKKVLDAGGILILFPEGGRTYKGSDFLYSKTGKKLES